DGPETRWKTIYALEETTIDGGASKALPVLERAMTDSDENVRSAVSYELVQIIGGEGTDAQTREKAYALLDKQLASPVVNIRVSAVRALGRWGNVKAISMLQKMLSDPAAKVRSVTAYELGNSDDEAALALLEKALAQPANTPPKEDLI